MPQTRSQKYSPETRWAIFQSAMEMTLAMMSWTPAMVRNMGAPATTSMSQTTASAACMGIDFFWPSMMMEQMSAVKPSDETIVGMATKGMPSFQAEYRPKSISVPPPTTTT